MSLKKILSPLFDLRLAGVAFAVVSALALVFALVAQFGFDLQPCILCLYQRIPYAVVMLLGGFAFFAPQRYLKPILIMIGLVFLFEAGLAFFHVGVEEQWWLGTEACSTRLDTSSIEALRAQILGTQATRCDIVQWRLFGLSMAGYNVLMSLGLMGAALLALRFSKD